MGQAAVTRCSPLHKVSRPQILIFVVLKVSYLSSLTPSLHCYIISCGFCIAFVFHGFSSITLTFTLKMKESSFGWWMELWSKSDVTNWQPNIGFLVVLRFSSISNLVHVIHNFTPLKRPQAVLATVSARRRHASKMMSQFDSPTPILCRQSVGIFHVSLPFKSYLECNDLAGILAFTFQNLGFTTLKCKFTSTWPPRRFLQANRIVWTIGRANWSSRLVCRGLQEK
jgi:hypothetical protein